MHFIGWLPWPVIGSAFCHHVAPHVDLSARSPALRPCDIASADIHLADHRPRPRRHGAGTGEGKRDVSAKKTARGVHCRGRFSRISGLTPGSAARAKMPRSCRARGAGSSAHESRDALSRLRVSAEPAISSSHEQSLSEAGRRGEDDANSKREKARVAAAIWR